jgi:hypothetical protein
MKTLLLLLISLPAAAQFTNPVRYVTVAPSGACSASDVLIYETRVTGVLTNCQNGVYTTIAGGGGGGGILDLTGTAGGATTGQHITFALSFTCSSSSITRSSNTLTFCFPPFATTPFLTTRTSSTVLTLASNCVAAPNTCQMGFGNTVYQTATSGTCTVSAGTGTMYEYGDPDGRIKCGSNGLTLSCSAGCDVTTSITGFPTTSNPLYTWTVTSGTWDANGGTDYRALLSTKNVSAGTAMTASELGGATTLNVDTTAVAQKFFGTAAPGSVSGNLPGDFFTDTTAHNQYVCNAPSGTAAPACTSVTAAGWLLVNSGGTVTASSTTTFTNKTFNQSILFSADGFDLASSSHYASNAYVINGSVLNLTGTRTIQYGGSGSSVSGCSNTPVITGTATGSFTSGVTGTCTVTITMGNSFVPNNDLFCTAYNKSVPANLVVVTASTGGTVTLSGTTASGNTINWKCDGI